MDNGISIKICTTSIKGLKSVQSHLQIILTVLNLHCHVACGPINGKQARKQISIETINPNKFAIESFMDDQSVKPSIATLWRNVALRTFNPAAAPRCLPSHVIAKPGMLIAHPVSSCFEQIQWADRFKHTSSIIIYLPWISRSIHFRLQMFTNVNKTWSRVSSLMHIRF